MSETIMTASSATLSRPVVISLRPRFADAILSGEKTVELRRHRMAAPLGTLLILYSSAPVMAVVGTAVLADRHTDRPTALWNRHRLHMSLTRAEFRDYLTGTDTGTALSLRDVVRLPTPFSLGHLRQEGAFQPPQSFRYLSSDDPEVLHHLFTAN